MSTHRRQVAAIAVAGTVTAIAGTLAASSFADPHSGDTLVAAGPAWPLAILAPAVLVARHMMAPRRARGAAAVRIDIPSGR